MNDRKREIIAEKFLDIGNYAITILAFSQFVAEKPEWNVAFVAVLLWMLCLLMVNIILH